MLAQKDEDQKASIANAQAAFNAGNVGAFDGQGGGQTPGSGNGNA
jgi:hypothetical protein